MAIALYENLTHMTDNNVSVDGTSGSNRLIVAYLCAGSNEDVTGITWNGEAMTRAVLLDRSAGRTSRYNSIWYILNPTGTGAQTMTWSGSLTNGMGLWATCVYTGVSGVSGATSNTSASATSFSISITADNGDWIGAQGQSTQSASVGANTTLRQLASSVWCADSNGVASPTAINMSSASADWGAVGIAIDVVAATGPANVKTINGLAKASVKTWNGLAIASVKSVNGLA